MSERSGDGLVQRAKRLYSLAHLLQGLRLIKSALSLAIGDAIELR